MITAAVEAAGGDARVMLDTNCPWSVEEALAQDRALAHLGLARVRAAGNHAIASGARDLLSAESRTTAHGWRWRRRGVNTLGIPAIDTSASTAAILRRTG